ncbi:MAG: sugar transferase [Anaerolineae bacterium]|nr:sugar transferase [Anaerolineae bacterium]
MVLERTSVKLYRPYYKTAKRCFELILCLFLIPILVPLGLIIALAIRLDTPGPIFFVQDRVGKGGRVFKMIKFRTMHQNLNKDAHQLFMKAFVNGTAKEEGQKIFKPFNSSEVTFVGRILRKTSLDELPQLINVFRGEMSLIGPRPNVVWEVEEYRGWHKERLEVLPGITGLAQVRGRSCISFDRIVEYDIEYVEKQSLKLDLLIIWWTISSVLFGRGAH